MKPRNYAGREIKGVRLPLMSSISRREALFLTGSGIAAGLLSGIDMAAAEATQCGPDISHGDRASKQIAFTFHGAGDPVIAKEIIAIVKSYKSPITVMAIGSWVTSNPTLIKLLVKDGHEIGNHTLNHKTMTRLNLKEAVAEISGGKQALAKVIGNGRTYFRPSGTPKSNSIIRSAAGKYGYKNCISYDVDSLDYQDPKPQQIIDTCLKEIKNGSIVSFHFGHKNTVKALPKLISSLTDSAFELVTLTTLLGKP